MSDIEKKLDVLEETADYVKYIVSYQKDMFDKVEDMTLEEFISYFAEFDRGLNEILKKNGSGFSTLPYLEPLILAKIKDLREKESEC